MTKPAVMTLDPSYEPPFSMQYGDVASMFGPHSTESDTWPRQLWFRSVGRCERDDDTAACFVALTNLLVPSAAQSPLVRLEAEMRAKAHKAREDRQAYGYRIAALSAYATQDGFELNPASKHDFMSFVRSEPFIRKARLVLMDNGNLRAVWKDGKGSHIGLQFLGRGLVQYVIFKRRRAGDQISRVSGRDTFEGVKRQISAFNLKSLMYG